MYHRSRLIIEEEMLATALPLTFLQIFCKIIFKIKVIVKGIIDPVDNL